MRDPVIVTDPAKTPLDDVDALAEFGAATVHEAHGPHRPRRPAVPARSSRAPGSPAPPSPSLCWPGDNLMIHAAVEQCSAGDILVVTTNSPSTDGMFGELFATALQARGVRGLVIDAGVRDVAELRAMGFPVWSAAVSAQGTVKATAGSVNMPVTLGAVSVDPATSIVADDDGVVVVPRADAPPTRSPPPRARLEKEEAAATAFRAGRARPGPLRSASGARLPSACGTCRRRSTGWNGRTTAVMGGIACTADARRHLQGRVLPRRGSALRPRERDDLLLRDHGHPRSRVRSTGSAARTR